MHSGGRFKAGCAFWDLLKPWAAKIPCQLGAGRSSLANKDFTHFTLKVPAGI
jgi:hypothetical protein